MVNKPMIVYGRKCLASKPSQVTRTAKIFETSQSVISPSKLDLEDACSQPGSNLQLFTESSNNPDPPRKPKTGKRKQTSKLKGKAKNIKASDIELNVEKQNEDIPSWAKLPTSFSSLEKISLLTTAEKTGIEANLEEAPNELVKKINTENEDIFEPVLTIHNSNVCNFSEIPVESTPAIHPNNVRTRLLPSKASPIVLPSPNLQTDEIELVGNAKLSTPKLASGVPRKQYHLRYASRRSAVDNISKSPIESSSFLPENVAQQSLMSLPPSGLSQKSVHFDPQVKISWCDPEALADGKLENHDSKDIAKDLSIPNIINYSEVQLGVATSPEQSTDLQKDLEENSNSFHAKEITNLNDDSFLLPSKLLESGGNSNREEPYSFSDGQPVVDEAKVQSETLYPSLKRYAISPIANASGCDALGEIDDVLGDLSVFGRKVLHKAGRTSLNHYTSDNLSATTTSLFNNQIGNLSIANQSSRLADMSMRRKSLLSHQVSTDDTFDEADFDEKKTTFLVLSPLRKRRSQIQLAPLDKLLQACEQSKVLPFKSYFTPLEKRNCVKIGEGVSGEVFKISTSKETRVIKFIPVNGNVSFNDADQKTFADILAEVIVSLKATTFARNAKQLLEINIKTRQSVTAMSTLDNIKDASPNFVAINKISLIQGLFPPFLVKLWDKFASTKGSENDHPKRFDKDQHFLVFDSVYGGLPLENFKFHDAMQSLSIFAQVACSLAVGETACGFEHRDLHWGNILVHDTKVDKLDYRVGSRSLSLNPLGNEVSIIDFTLSRCSENGVVVFTNLSQDEGIFMGEGDFQFEVYRLMRKECNDNWSTFMPRTNCFWLQYLLDKLLNRVKYKAKSETHAESMEILLNLYQAVQLSKSASSFVFDFLIPISSSVLSIEE